MTNRITGRKVGKWVPENSLSENGEALVKSVLYYNTISLTDTSGISSQSSTSTLASREEIHQIEFTPKSRSSRGSSRSGSSSKLEAISPYETAIVEDSLKSFMYKKQRRY